MTEFHLSYFKSWMMMLWKCYTQHASKFGKLSSGHRAGKGQFSFQSQRTAMPKNVQTTTQLHSPHILAKKCSKFFKQGFNSMWIMNFQMFKLDTEKAEEPEIKLPTFIELLKKQASSRKTSTSASLTTPKPLTVWVTTNCGKFWKGWEYQTTWPASWEICIQVKKQQLELDMKQQTGSKSKGVHQGHILSPCLFNLYAEYIMQNARLDEDKLESGLLGEVSITSDKQMTPPLKVVKN